MIIDLHIHTKDGSDGLLSVKEIFNVAKNRNIGMMSITDHDSVECQERALQLAEEYGIRYVTGVELGITNSHPDYKDGKPINLDILSYGFDHHNQALMAKLEEIREHRELRARKILDNINIELEKEGKEPFTDADMEAIKATADGSIGRPHIADYMISKGIVQNRQESFERYLEDCNFPKYPLYLEDAAKLMRDAGGILILAHPNIIRGPSLKKLTDDVVEQTKIIEDTMLGSLDGIECWHTQMDKTSTEHFLSFVKSRDLMATGGSDCHQNPILIGSVEVPGWVADKFTK